MQHNIMDRWEEWGSVADSQGVSWGSGSPCWKVILPSVSGIATFTGKECSGVWSIRLESTFTQENVRQLSK